MDDNEETEHRRFHKTSLIRPIVGLTENLPKNILEKIVVEALERYRLLRDTAERAFAKCGDEASSGAVVSDARLAYIRAMIDCHAQQASLSTLLDVLGYVPDYNRGRE